MGDNSPHQLPRTAGSNSSSTVICKGQIQGNHSAEDRQHHSSGLHQPPGGNSLQGAGQLDKGSVDVVLRGKHTHHSPAPPRYTEYHRRCRITVTDGQDRLEAEPLNISQDSENLWPTGSGSLCNSVCLLQLAARSIYRSNRCISPSVDSHQGICQPTLEPGRQDTSPGADPTSHHSASGTSVEIPTLVPYTSTHVGRLPQTDSSRNRDNGQQRQLTDAPTTSCMAYFRERYRSQQLSEEATDLMLSS